MFKTSRRMAGIEVTGCPSAPGRRRYARWSRNDATSSARRRGGRRKPQAQAIRKIIVTRQTETATGHAGLAVRLGRPDLAVFRARSQAERARNGDTDSWTSLN